MRGDRDETEPDFGVGRQLDLEWGLRLAGVGGCRIATIEDTDSIDEPRLGGRGRERLVKKMSGARCNPALKRARTRLSVLTPSKPVSPFNRPSKMTADRSW